MRIKFSIGQTKYSIEVIMTAIRIYLSYSTSYRNVEEILKEQDVSVDHTPTQRWVIKYISKLLQKFIQHKLEVGENWQLDEIISKLEKSEIVRIYVA